eukprot:1473810-Amphidinium_carterae.1
MQKKTQNPTRSACIALSGSLFSAGASPPRENAGLRLQRNWIRSGHHPLSTAALRRGDTLQFVLESTAEEVRDYVSCIGVLAVIPAC